MIFRELMQLVGKPLKIALLHRKHGRIRWVQNAGTAFFRFKIKLWIKTCRMRRFTASGDRMRLL